MASLTKKMTKQEILDLRQKLSSHIVKEKKPDYTYYQIKTDSMTITAYTSGKVVFQGGSFLDGRNRI